ncbi:MAG: hypothetical protein JSU87_09720, partial [Gemmatimonadota bacterium]
MMEETGGVAVMDWSAAPGLVGTLEAGEREDNMLPLAAERADAQLQPLSEAMDNELVARFLEGNGLAFPELVRRYQSRLLNFIYRTIGDRDRAEDLVQETFIRVYRHLHRFDQ